MTICAHILFPLKSNHSVYIDKYDCDRDHEAEKGFHPRLYFHAFAGVGFGDEIVPAPAELIAAEQSENKRAERKNGGRYYEVPEIKPGCTGGKRLEFKYTESERRS